MKDPREEVKSRMKWAGLMVRMKRREITEKIRDKEVRRLQRMKKTTAKKGGLCKDRCEKGKGQQQGPTEKFTKVGVQRSDN